MSNEVFDLVCAMNRSSIEMQLVVQCAPLFAGLKISNLLIISEEHKMAFQGIMDESDLSVYFLTRFNGKLVYLLFSYEELEIFLQNSEVQAFFLKEGYEELSVHAILRKFRARYEEHMISGVEFPHEMGLILGYPIEDVKGFIENEGNNYLYSGYWKVYKKPEEKKRIFKSYDNATELIVKMMSHGMTMSDIIGIKKSKYCIG